MSTTGRSTIRSIRRDIRVILADPFEIIECFLDAFAHDRYGETWTPDRLLECDHIVLQCPRALGVDERCCGFEEDVRGKDGHGGSDGDTHRFESADDLGTVVLILFVALNV